MASIEQSPRSPAPAGGLVARATGIVLLAAAAVAWQVPSRFSLDDTRAHVRRVQGNPGIIERLASLHVERWYWGASAVTFDPATGRVIGWEDRSRTLRVALRAATGSRDSLLTLGMPLTRVARLLGTPWAVRPAAHDQLLLAYGRSVVRVDRASRTVSGWARGDASLPAAHMDDAAAHAAMGATPLSEDTRVTRTAVGAAISVSFVKLTDQSGDGRLDDREFADVTFRVRNVGTGLTSSLGVQVLHGSGLARLAGAPDTIQLPSLEPGDSTELSFPVYTTGRERDPELALVVWAGGAAFRATARMPTSAPAARPAPDSTEIPIDRAPRAMMLNPDALAIVIGVERYQRLPEARHADRDARLIRSYVTQTFGVPDDALHLVMRLDGEASGSELRRLTGERGWLARRASENTDLIVYFAGHGALGSHQVPHLLPADADPAYVDETGIDLHALFDRLARLPARSITVILDACFSGMTRTGRPLVPGSRAAVVSLEHPALVRRNMAVIVASRGSQAAGDLPARRQGALTWFVARGLQGEADANRDASVSVAELGAFVERGVMRASAALDREQHPMTIARDSARVLVRLNR